MSTKRKLTILVVPDKTFPVRHALLENVFCRGLTRRGHRVIWFMRSPAAARFGVRAEWQGCEVFLAPLGRREGRLEELADDFYRKPAGMARILGLIREEKVDIVQVRNDLPAAFFAWLAARRSGIPFSYYLAYPHLEGMRLQAERGMTRTKYAARIYARALMPVQDWLTRRADFVFTMSEHWRKKVVSEQGLPPGRVRALPFGFDTSISPGEVDGNVIRKKFGLEGRPVVLYIGTIAPPRDTALLIGTMERIAKKVPEAKLLVLPIERNLMYVPGLEREFEKKGLAGTAVFAPPVSHEEVCGYIAAADVGLSPIEPIPLYEVSSPAKFIEMLGMGCPVVASDIPEQRNILEASGGGVCVPYDPASFAGATIDLLKDPEAAKEMGARGRRYAREHRSFDRLTDMVEEVYLSLV
jgi:glycosyltransferase involved in cell wall biosynthesis